MPEAEPEPRILEYHKPSRRTPRWLDWTCGILAILFVVWVVYELGGTWLRNRRNSKPGQSAPAMAYEQVSTRVGYEEDPERAAVLLKSAEYRAVRPIHSEGANEGAAFVPQIWNALCPPTNGDGQVSATLYVHGRRGGSGEEKRLMVVTLISRLYANEYQYAVLVSQRYRLDPSGDKFMGMSASEMLVTSLSRHRGPDQRLRLYFGQTDSNDESHFTIRYELGTQSGTIDGWLMSDGDGVKMAVRDGPLK